MVQSLVFVMVILPKFYDGLFCWVCFWLTICLESMLMVMHSVNLMVNSLALYRPSYVIYNSDVQFLIFYFTLLISVDGPLSTDVQIQLIMTVKTKNQFVSSY